MTYLFTTPSVPEKPAALQRPFHRVDIKRGITLIKDDPAVCAYREVRYPTEDDLAAAAVYYLGGRQYVVSDAEAACLTSAGYGDFLVPYNVGFGENGYGEGFYGLGDYGA